MKHSVGASYASSSVPQLIGCTESWVSPGGPRPRAPGQRSPRDRLERMLPDVDLRLLRKQVAEDRARIHRRVDLLAVGHHRVAGQRVVMLPTRQLTKAADRPGD